ncbi:hypothetical protein Q1695_002012 [Nippostrongylus brasiliensis]|nr:hypothetical protein Q1695_002012 [Nippostrongylus brasiliensis]
MYFVFVLLSEKQQMMRDEQQLMQPILSSTGGCFADLSTSSFSALPSLPPSEQFNNEASISRSSSGGVHTKLSEYLLTGAYSGTKSLQQQKSMFDAAASSTSCSPPLTPPALDLLKPGMRDVPAWLKSLRLHKYTAMFTELTYEEMMALDEIELERRNVTKGARTKILQSIQKLYSRASDLRAMHERLSPSHPQRCLRCAIATLRQMIATPMIPYVPAPGESSDCVDGFVCISYINDRNVPGLIFNLLGEIQRAVFVSGRQPMDVEYEYLLMLFTVFDKLSNNEAFTPMQKQRVHQWKRLARKAIRPADVRRQRVGLPHSGKCEICHYKDIALRDSGKQTVKMNGGTFEKTMYQAPQQQHRTTNTSSNYHFPPSAQDWSQLMRGTSPITPSPMVVQQQRRQNAFSAGYWHSNFPLDTNYLNETRNGPRQLTPMSAQAFTQNLPQYRSQQHSTANDNNAAIPLLSGSSLSFEGSSRWPRAIYENHELIARGNAACGRIRTNNPLVPPPMSLWESLATTCPSMERSGEATSGYCSSTSERSSGAGSPRACGPGQTLYDRVCRDVAALQLSI